MNTLPSPSDTTPLLPWLLQSLAPMSRTSIKELLRSGRVQVNETSITRHDHILQPTDRICIVREVRPAPEAPFPILHDDEHFIVIEKPAGLLTVATDTEKLQTAYVLLRDWLQERNAGRPFVVHRLDRETSGLLLFARSIEMRDRLQEAWPTVRKKYLAVVEGVPQRREGRIETDLVEGRDLRMRICRTPTRGMQHAITAYRVLQEREQYSLVEVELLTGRKHQIRVHLAHVGCPVLGDAMYGAKLNPAGRLALHAWQLALKDPISGTWHDWESPLPNELEKLMNTV